MVQTMMASKAVEGVAQNKATPYIIGGVIIAGIGLAYIAVVRPILCITGTVKCKKDKKALSIMSYKGFDPNYYRPKKLTISSKRAKELADQIHASGGVFNDDEGGFYAVLEAAGSADNLSFIAKMFAIRHDQSLAEYITYYLDDPTESDRIKDIIEAH